MHVLRTERLALAALTQSSPARPPRTNTDSLRVLEKLGMRRVGFAGATPRFEL
jgi:hypothetical protein